jgi:hypothetical protein
MTDAAYGMPPAPAGRRSWRAEVKCWISALAGVRGAPLVAQDAHDDGAEWAERAGLDGGAAAAAVRAGHSGADLAAAATFASSAVRDLARIAGELDPVAAADGGCSRSGSTRSCSP